MKCGKQKNKQEENIGYPKGSEQLPASDWDSATPRTEWAELLKVTPLSGMLPFYSLFLSVVGDHPPLFQVNEVSQP